MIITPATQQDYSELIAIWEASVRATHHFLNNADIESLRPLILVQYFDAVTLQCARNEQGTILGFCGVAENKLEMLFVHPDHFGKGVGTALCRHAMQKMHVTAVDVNEQNPKATGFYKHMGFVITGRSAVDGQSNPFPLLHMTQG
ncbi:MAG: acetyltransferase [Halodesulfovibrio sp.]